MTPMSNNDDPEKLLSQSKEQFAKYLESQDSDVFAEAGELLWESLKANMVQETNIKTNNFKTLTMAASQMGERFNKLFFHCCHFHSWYLGIGVPNDFAAEKKLYLESVKSLEKIIRNKGNNRRTRKKELEKAT
jgi:hypothetical protein